MCILELRKALSQAVEVKASKIRYSVSDSAPSTPKDLITHSKTLIVWSGESDNTIFLAPQFNHAFRAIHDALHLTTGLDFTVDHEITIGRIQANQFSGILADMVYNETAGQAEYFKRNGVFVTDQLSFAQSFLKAA